MVFTAALQPRGWKTYIENVKVKIGNEDIYLYPDIVIMNPAEEASKANKNYIISHPSLIAEVLSDLTCKYDSTDKFIQYQKISSLKYYLLVEPEKQVVIFYEKDDNGEWSSKPYTKLTEIIALPFFQIEFALADIYS